MTVVFVLLLVLHMVGLAGALVGLLRQVRSGTKVIDAVVRHSVTTQLVSGLLLVGVVEGGDEPVNHGKIAVKLVVALVLTVLAYANRRNASVPDGLFWGFVGLEVVNVVVAFTL